jgi:hypothetical protein
MAIATYNHFANGITIRGVPIVQAYPGKVFWVNNSGVLQEGEIGASDGNKGTMLQPFSTINGAVSKCLAGRGDVIMVKPGHIETVAAAAGVALTKAGVAVIGLGSGSLRPKFNLTATSSTVTMSAANCALVNVLVTGGIDAVVSHTVVSAADCALVDFEYRDVTGQCTDGLLTTAGANRLWIERYRHDGDTAAGTNAGIAIVGGDGIVIKGLRMDGNFAVGGIDIRTTATTDIEISDVVFRTRNSADIFLIDTITASTGMIGPNIQLRLQDNAANITEAITGATFVQFLPINVVNLAGELAMSINTTASTDA